MKFQVWVAWSFVKWRAKNRRGGGWIPYPPTPVLIGIGISKNTIYASKNKKTLTWIIRKTQLFVHQWSYFYSFFVSFFTWEFCKAEQNHCTFLLNFSSKYCLELPRNAYAAKNIWHNPSTGRVKSSFLIYLLHR